MPPLISAIFLAQGSIGHYWHKLTDRTFTGVYHANAFDLAMMIPYFLVLFVLAAYGLHRYWLRFHPYVFSKKRPRPAARGQKLAPGYRSASHFQRALRDRAPRRSRLALRLPARTAGRSGP